MTWKKELEYGKQVLKEAKIADGDLDAWYLLSYTCHITRSAFFLNPDTTMSQEEVETYREFIEKRKNHIPLQYLTGEQSFMGLDFYVDSNVLIPRQDTESLVEEVLKKLKTGMHILDMCTGSGCILISLLTFSKGTSGVGVDLSTGALEVARKNAKIHKVEAEFIESDLFQNVQGEFDIIISNPPYIRTEELSTLMPEVREHEPLSALDGTEDGLAFYRNITKESLLYLKKDGWLFFEIGWDQGEQVKAFMKESGYCDVEVLKDLAGLERIVYGRKVK